MNRGRCGSDSKLWTKASSSFCPSSLSQYTKPLIEPLTSKNPPKPLIIKSNQSSPPRPTQSLTECSSRSRLPAPRFKPPAPLSRLSGASRLVSDPLCCWCPPLPRPPKPPRSAAPRLDPGVEPWRARGWAASGPPLPPGVGAAERRRSVSMSPLGWRLEVFHVGLIV